ncbi:MAG: DNA cytosine methyltransferase [Agrobacterium tumefaciens]|nr:DNA cytosine methyltransferase [Agrobacterium tumefaciens]
MRLSVASMFCGVGGLDLGFERAGCDVVWASDISSIAAASYPLNFGRQAVQADILDLDCSSIPDTDIIIGGPPCQSFSLVGLRRPDDERGRLVFRFLDIIKTKMPLGFVMENVPGLTAARIDNQRLSDRLIGSFTALGYNVTAVKLDASQYLVPQMRKRVFLIGSLRLPVTTPSSAEFAAKAYGVDINKYDNSTWAAIGDLGKPVGKGELATYSTVKPSLFAHWMREDAHGYSLHEYPRMSETDKRLVSFIPPGGNYTDVPDEYATQRILNFKRTGGRTTTYGRLHPCRPSYTVNTYFRRPNVGANFHPSEDRLITVREAMRLQGLPDRFHVTAGPQDARNALIGNAVPPFMAQAVARELMRALSKTPHDLGHSFTESGFRTVA